MLRAKQRFDSGLLRVRNLDSLYVHLTSVLHFPKEDVSDILRNELVYSVSSFDKFVHDIVQLGMVETFIGSRPQTSAYNSFGITLQQFSAITVITSIPPPETIFENTIANNHKHLSFQEPDKVSAALSLIWTEDHKWQKIATCIGRPENIVKTELKNIIIRRNQIVHEADIDLATGLVQHINHSDVRQSVNFIEAIANCIYSLVK